MNFALRPGVPALHWVNLQRTGFVPYNGGHRQCSGGHAKGNHDWGRVSRLSLGGGAARPIPGLNGDSNQMDHAELVAWLKEDDPGRLETLWQRADAARREYVGAQVHLRGLIEFTNHCQRHCLYCGLRFPNQGLARYRMTADEILECAHTAVRFGYGTVVLQSGEDTEPKRTGFAT